MARLFLLKPNFIDSKIDTLGLHYYCPYSAFIEGILSYYPKLRQHIDITYVDFPRPRRVIIDLVGEENQGCPILIITKEENETIDTSYFKTYGDLRFINDTSLITRFLAEKYKIGLPHP